MDQKHILLKIVTPLLIGDVHETIAVESYFVGNQVVTSEKIINANLNAKAFKGVLRWWFRTIHGWSSKLKNREEQLFGSTKGASPVKMMIEHDLEPERWNRSIKVEPYGNYQANNRQCDYNGLKYFGYTNFFPPTKTGVLTVRKCYMPGGSFKIKLIGANISASRYFFLFWLAIQFGGFGNRSRRCFGNLQILSPIKFKVSDKYFYFKNIYKSIDEYKECLLKNLEVANLFFPRALQGTSEISCFKDAHLFLSEPLEFKSWEETINFAGATMQKFRALAFPEHDILQESPFPQLDLVRPIFGLPIQFRFSGNGIQPVILNVVDDNDEQTRLASPIIVSIVEINKKYHIQYLILSRNFESINIEAIRGDENKKVSILNDAISRFVKHLKSFELEGEIFRYEQIF